MELVYLWVEDYKNIHKQGFNFLPRYECKFHDEYDEDDKLKDDCKLEIIEKKDDEYIKDFFGENINVTAIVGKNGSGKSSVLNAIINCGEKSFPEETNFILVYQSGDKRFYISNTEIKTSIQKVDNFQDLIIYIDREDNDGLPINAGATRLSSFKRYKQTFTNYMKVDTSKETIINLLVVEIGKINSSFELSTFMYLPNRISINLKTPRELISNHINFISKDRQKVEDYFMTLSDIEHQILIIEYLRKRSIKSKFKTIQNKNNLQRICKKYNISKILKLNHKPVEKQYINELTEEDKKLYARKGGFNHLLEFDLIDEKDRTYNNLSHGEKVLFGQLLNIYFYSINYSHEIFLFDEPEISLHPDWQKRYINEVYNLLKKMKGNNHFIFTSHSPFLLSDIPKQNIIFLDKDEKGNCKVVDGLKKKKQTFGANIHTLLSDSFFMEDGLMGEFAKSKINEIIDFQKLVKKNRHIDCLTKIYLHSKQKNFWQTQKIIGEEYLKQVIKNHLVEIEKKLLGKDRAKQEEIKRVEAYLESLKK